MMTGYSRCFHDNSFESGKYLSSSAAQSKGMVSNPPSSLLRHCCKGRLSSQKTQYQPFRQENNAEHILHTFLVETRLYVVFMCPPHLCSHIQKNEPSTSKLSQGQSKCGWDLSLTQILNTQLLDCSRHLTKYIKCFSLCVFIRVLNMRKVHQYKRAHACGMQRTTWILLLVYFTFEVRSLTSLGITK